MDIQNDKKILQWFSVLDLAEKTKENYLLYLKVFSECTDKTPGELIDESIEETKQGKLLSERAIVSHLAKFKQCIKQKGFAPSTQTLAMAAIRSFYRFFDIQLPSAISKSKRGLPLRENQNFLNKEDIVKLITNSKSLRDKAIILCMATSGMARQEIINLRIKDITFDNENIGIISIRRQKSQVDYTTFISPEAVEALRNYFDERNRLNNLRVKGKNDLVFVTYDTGIKLTKGTFAHIFKQLADQLGYTNGEYQIKSKSHALRKYFATTLENSGMAKNKIDFMLGHTPNGNDRAYFRTDIEALRQLYIKFLPYLTFEKEITVRSLDTEDAKRLEALDRENKELKKEMQEIKKDLDSRKGADDTLEKLFSDPEVRQILLKKVKELGIK